ncbi:flagellar basal body rod protein FlgB [Rhodoplanes sp. Z2-YC6860]|uniref:flagellar basal body rod protein FlgB n=1 Tax=Rhodoplanes sp. Z2-YC6860 TaxID=674703 RepID=UPI00078E6373|nr:flagellar basal body rod protein FlgB [Rhodoplanes sp. Z2-YC6860]AMN43283.1 flagellar basal body rod protein FlgB [Rhodoplanes sp. Z2-YC6860]
MSITDLPLFSMLRSRMQWHQERQRVLAQNVANSDTRDFQPRDLNPLKFENVEPGMMTVSLRRTESNHMNASGGSATGFQTGQSRGFESRVSATAVNLEDEMMKVAANQMDYQAASSLYIKSLGLIKIAIGKR